MTSAADIQSQPIADQVHEFLQGEIVRGHLKAGERIVERDLCARLGISRTPIREALLKLEVAGIIESTSRRSYHVRFLTVTDAKEIFEILGVLEGAVVGAVAETITENDLDLLKEFNRRMTEMWPSSDFHAYGAWNEKFHDVFISKYQNQTLRKVCDTVRRQLYTFPVRQDSLTQWLEKSIKEHEEIIRLAAARNGPALAAFFRDTHWNQVSHGPYIEDAFAGGRNSLSQTGTGAG